MLNSLSPEMKQHVAGEHKRYEEQLEGLKRAFGMAFEEYQARQHGELPVLKTSRDVDIFVKSRAPLSHAIDKLTLVRDDIGRIGLQVLKEKSLGMAGSKAA